LFKKQLETETYGISAKGVSEKGYVHYPDSTLTELFTLKDVEKDESWGSATVSFINKDDGKLKHWTVKIEMGYD